MTAESRVNQDSIQCVDLGLPLGLRHEGLQVQVLWIFHILMNTKQLINFSIMAKYRINKSNVLGSCPISVSPTSQYLCNFASSEVCKAFQ